MKKILFILLVFCVVHANAQKVRAEVIELDTLTTTEKNALTVPAGKVQIVYDETIGNFYGNVKNGGWATLASVLGALTSSDIGVTVQGYNANTDIDSTDDLTTSDLIDDDTFATATATNVASAESIKAYVDTEIAGVGGSGDVTAASNFGTDNVLIRSDGTTKGVQSSGITIDDSDNVSMAGDLVMGTNRIFMSGGALDHGDGGFYTGVDDGVSGQRWLITKDPTTDELSFGYQSSAGTSTAGAYPDLYTMNEAGAPTVSTDLVHIGFLQAGLDDLSGVIDASAFSGNLATTDDTLQEIADAVDGLSTGGGSSPPFDDNSPHIRDNVDNSKTVTIVADDITTATNRNLRMPDADVDLGNLGSTNIDLTDNYTWTGTHTHSQNTYMNDLLTIGNEGYYQGEDEGTSGKRWLFQKDQSNENYLFLLQDTEETSYLTGTYTRYYRLNSSGVPSNTDDLTDVAYINSRILNTAFGAGWSSVTANSPSQASVYTEMIKKLNSVTTGEPTGSDAISNIVSLTQAEYDAGTPVAGTYYLITNPVTPEVIQIACSDLTTDVTTGTSKAYFRMPWAATLTDVRVSLLTAGTTTGLTVDINESGTTVLSTKLTTDATEKTSTTATTAAVISDSALADDAEITIDFDAVPTGGQGVIVTLYVEY